MAEYSTGPTKDKATGRSARRRRSTRRHREKPPARPSTPTTSTCKNMLIAKALGCPHAHCKIKSIDIAPAEKVPGVVHVEPHRSKPATRSNGKATCSPSSPPRPKAAAAEGLAAIKVEYEMLRLRQRRRPGRRRSGRPHEPGGGKRAAEQRARGRRGRRRVRRQGDRAAAQGIGRTSSKATTASTPSPTVPGAARLDRRVGRRQADGPPLDAERLAAPTTRLRRRR